MDKNTCFVQFNLLVSDKLQVMSARPEGAKYAPRGRIARGADAGRAAKAV
jgi:hypothetical protein